MENEWTLIPLVVILGIGFFYFAYRDEPKTGPKEYLWKIIDAFLGNCAHLIFRFIWL